MPLFYPLCPLVLASGSPRRQELLSSVGVAYSVRVSPTEAEPLPQENPAVYAQRAALGKAASVLSVLRVDGQKIAVLAADTIVVFKGHIFGKPKDHAQAFDMLQNLSGQTHTVITACCLLVKNAGKLEQDCFYLQSKVTMWSPPTALLKAYAESEEPMDKAGAYAVQGSGAFMVRSIEGSWSNVVGLPLSEVVERLLEHNIIIPAHS
jgi:septum formation protein